jgi:uncharacterized membrane-anchored protein
VHALIVADGDVPSRAALGAGWPGWDREIELVVAADGGWDKATTLGFAPGLLVGDADSLPAARFASRSSAPPPPRTSRTRSWHSWPLSGGERPT